MSEERKYIEGFGSIIKKSFKRKRPDGSEYVYESPNLYIAYYHNGEELRESAVGFHIVMTGKEIFFSR